MYKDEKEKAFWNVFMQGKIGFRCSKKSEVLNFINRGLELKYFNFKDKAKKSMTNVLIANKYIEFLVERDAFWFFSDNDNSNSFYINYEDIFPQVDEFIIVKNYMTFNKASKLGKKLKHKTWDEFKTKDEAIETISEILKYNTSKAIKMLTKKVWEVENTQTDSTTYDFKNKYKEGKYEIKNEEYGHIFYDYIVEKMKFDTGNDFENDEFILRSFDWDGGTDCNCGLEDKAGDIYYSVYDGTNHKEAQKKQDQYLHTHMHSEDCGDKEVNFYNKPTGLKISYYKHLDWIECMNYPVTIEEFKTIMEKCYKSFKESNDKKEE